MEAYGNKNLTPREYILAIMDEITMNYYTPPLFWSLHLIEEIQLLYLCTQSKWVYSYQFQNKHEPSSEEMELIIDKMENIMNQILEEKGFKFLIEYSDY